VKKALVAFFLCQEFFTLQNVIWFLTLKNNKSRRLMYIFRSYFHET